MTNCYSEMNGRETNEKCEKKLRHLITDRGLLEGKALVSFDRVHRLGRKKTGARFPRPIVCRLTYYKDKEMILKNAPKLRGSNISMCEQFSQETQELHSQLFSACKAAKEQENSPILKFYINYKHAAVHFRNGSKKNFNIDQINSKSDWYKFDERNF